ncbi:stress responsive alpha-beta barrel domain protein [Artemisia annua]|uniref:Stress responsive alpha-beta barrel domain protein n=1 Tax=Artemisia annua TaxID=35608 RepID=A0A2U1QC02_ARTAN|nr:stress responsive alpha-beta barrel domain protein [Artemisia annua]
MSTNMLCTPAHTRLFPSLLSSSSLKLKQPQLLFNNRRNNHTIKMSSNQNQFIEHIVLFKVKPDIDSQKVNSMVNSLNSLTSLNLTLHLSSGQLHKSRSTALTFTHILHSRYKTVEDLKTYAVHPEHVRVVNEHVKPVCDDIMAVDWRSEGGLKCVIEPGKAMRVTFVKLKDEKYKSKVLEVIRGVKDEFGGVIEEYSVGENFSERAKGYEIATVAVFNGVEEMEKMDAEKVRREKEKVKEFVESVVVVDYVVPVATHSANL